MTFGIALTEKTTNNQVKKNYFNFSKDKRSFVLRILPPFGSLKDNPLGWAKYWAVHFGYTDSNGKMRPFASPLRKKDGAVIVRDPAMERIWDLQKKLETASSEEEKNKILEQLKRFNCSKKWYLNAVDLEGNIGLFGIPHKMMLALEVELKRLQQEGHSPLSLDKGLFLEFSKEGSGRDTVHKVSLYMDTVSVNGKKYKAEKTHTIDDAFAARAEKECFDLGKLYITPTPEEIESIVNGGPQALEAVFAKYKNSESTNSDLQKAKNVLGGSSGTSVTQVTSSDVIDYDSLLDDVV